MSIWRTTTDERQSPLSGSPRRIPARFRARTSCPPPACRRPRLLAASVSRGRPTPTSKGEKLPVTPAMALRLGRSFGNSPEFRANLRRDYDLHTLEAEMAEELVVIETAAA